MRAGGSPTLRCGVSGSLEETSEFRWGDLE